MRKGLIIFFSFMLFFCGCTTRYVDFTIISSKNIDFKKSASFKQGTTRITGEDKVHIIIFIPTGTASIKEAIDNAIKTTPGCIALLDGVVYGKFWWIPYIYGQSVIIVEGTPLIDTSLIAEDNKLKIPTYSKITVTDNKKITTLESISSAEYIAMKCEITGNSQVMVFHNSNDIK